MTPSSSCADSVAWLTRLLHHFESAGLELGGGLPHEWHDQGLLETLEPCPEEGHFFLVRGAGALCTHHSRPGDGPPALEPALEVLGGRFPRNFRFACYSMQEVVAFSHDGSAEAGCPDGGEYRRHDAGGVRCSRHGPARPQPLEKPGVPPVVHLPRAWLRTRIPAV